MKDKESQSYKEFLRSKYLVDIPTGFEIPSVNSKLFEFQKDIVKWSCRRGRAAVFADCGLGKTAIQLCWANGVVNHTGGKILIFAPLGVTYQTQREGKKFGIKVRIVKSQEECSRPGIYITNYEKLHRFDLTAFVGIIIDESSILKSQDGKTRTALIDASCRIPYRLACTAVPAPNDYMELGNHSEFVGAMDFSEMLTTFFVHDGGETQKWRLKGHAQQDFWKWMCSWAVNIRKPSDLGYSDEGFVLPPLNLQEHIVTTSQRIKGFLFPVAQDLQQQRIARRNSMGERVARACEIAADDQQYIFWCDLNDESELIADKLDAVEVRGSTSEEDRERIILGFLDGTIRRVVSKPSLWGFGLNLQCCHNAVFVGINNSYEQFYQAVRRLWRFGQEKIVNIHIVVSEQETEVLRNIKRKEVNVTRMGDRMIDHMRSISFEMIKGQVRDNEAYRPQKEMELPAFI